LREAKEEVEIKRDNLEGSLKEKSYSYDQLLLDYRTLQRRVIY
jgi:progesterone-induced-blocking factor 1